MASRLVRINPVTVNQVLDGHVKLDLECLDRLYLHGYLGQLQVGGQVVQFLRHRSFPVPSPACLPRSATDSAGRSPRSPTPTHPGGAAEVRGPQHRGDGALPVRRGAHRPLADGRDRCSAGAAACVHRPPARHRSVQARRNRLRQEGPPRHGLLLLPLGHRFRNGRSSRSALTARGRSRSGSTATNGPNVKRRTGRSRRR
jgi:hypothetical protein